MQKTIKANRDISSSVAPICLACDLDITNGEGRLARLLIRNKFDLKIGVEQKQSILDAKSGDILTPKAVSGSRWQRAVPAYMWLLKQTIQLHFVNKPHVAILNYLPLWNILFFLLVPKSVILGPITGSGPVNHRHLALSRWQYVSINLTRNCFIPLLYKLSALIIKWRSLSVKPATPAVSFALGYTDSNPRFVEANCLPIKFVGSVCSGNVRSIDAIAYIGPHCLKNSALTIQVMNNLASDGYKIVLIGQTGPGFQIHESVEHHSILNHDTLLSYMRSCITSLSLSVEQGGFFSFEAAASGCVTLCWPNSGGARLPRAILLAADNEYVSVDLMVERCKSAIKTVRVTSTIGRKVIFETLEMHKDATAFFYTDL